MGQKGGTKEVNLFVIGETYEEYEVQEGLTGEGRGVFEDGMGRIWAVRTKVQGGPVENDHRHCQKAAIDLINMFLTVPARQQRSP